MEKMENVLAIQKYLREHGLEKTREDFSLSVKSVGDSRVLFKYDQIESRPKDHPVVMDARGIILDQYNNWNVISMSFRRFFNYGEAGTELYDFTDAVVLKKLDGSLIQVYNYAGEWYSATSGTIDGNTQIDDLDMQFSDLFWNTASANSGLSIEQFKERLVSGRTYIFELCTPYNIVVTPHSESVVYLLGIRDIETLKEMNVDDVSRIAAELGVLTAPRYNMPDTIEDLVSYAKDMPFDEEGFVVTNSKMERCKIKSPAYVAAHHLKGSTAAYKILDIVKSNEIDEYIVLFPTRSDEVGELKEKYEKAIRVLDETLIYLKERFDNKKDLAMFLKENAKDMGVSAFTAYFYRAFDGKSETARSFLSDYDTKKLYNILKS